MRTIDVGVRLGDAIDPFHLANGFEAVIGYECQERSNPTPLLSLLRVKVTVVPVKDLKNKLKNDFQVR
jgi:hypothetical protein